MKPVLGLAVTSIISCNVHLTAQNGQLEHLSTVSESDLCAYSSSGFNALFYAAQASNAYDVTKFLLDHKCNLNQENIANLQPIHALLANDKLSAREIVDTIGLYRINGHEVSVSAYPIHTVFDYPIRNFLFGFGPDAYLSRNQGLSETEVVTIKSAMTSPINDVFDKIMLKSSNELLAEFDARHAERDARRQAELDKMKGEVGTLSELLESSQADYEGRIGQHEKDRVATVKKLEEINQQLDREFDRHANVETQLNAEKLNLEKAIAQNHDEREQLINEHESAVAKLDDDVSKLNDEIESMSKDDISQKLRIQTLEDEITTAQKALQDKSTDVDDCVESSQIEKRQSDEKISEYLEQIAKLTLEKEAAQVELDNERDVAAKARTDAGTAQNKLAELAGEVLSCQEALKKCPAFSEVP